LLQNVGWLEHSVSEGNVDPAEAKTYDRTVPPLPCGCTENIWKEYNASDAFLGNHNMPPLERIPPNALFLIDGNGLAFHLHSIAYARYLQSLEKNGSCSNSNTNNDGRVNRYLTTKAIMVNEAATTMALPCMLPLSILREVVKEFAAGLKGRVSEIQVLWDGQSSRFKAKTHKQRQMERDRRESYLELYCNHGTLITAKKKQHLEYVCQWKEVFPFSKLFGTCVRHAFQEIGVQSIFCVEEADVELARKASGDSRAYVLGLDSDFFFYKDIQYIPLNQISIQPSGLHAFVARRSELSRLLGFEHNDNRLIDLALLMGNDYVDPFLCLETPDEIDLTSVQSMVYYLQCNEDFEAMAKDNDSKATVDFVRSLYNLQSLDLYPLDSDESILEENGADGIHETEFELETQILPQDTAVRDAILRYLRMTLDRVGGHSKFPLTEAALHAFEITSTPTRQLNKPNLNIRPSYREMKAAMFIERCISRFYRRSQKSLLIRATPPEFLMSRLHFHATLASLREPINERDDAHDEEIQREEGIESEPTFEQIRLPIDDHEDHILENIRNHRVTIIHGETGCGKSSRVPVMLLKSPPPDESLSKVKFFISQPRRIAAKALVERVRSCEPELKNKFALRMGHGWREYETKDTQVFFVTTGYLVRLLANHPERFDNCTHLVIDEVHERSVDTDILCLLCRRLLDSNKTIRLVLMSATLATKLYKDYFNVLNEPIHVGVRRYPITEYFVEDLQRFGLPQQEATAALAIQKENETKFCITAPTSNEMKNRFSLAARLSTIVGEPGSSVLIFVPGMAEIVAISELIETYHKAGIKYTCFPIHSDIPFEEQMDAFDAPSENEVKIIIATNAAESSVTLPNVDHVICLGLCRQIVYNQASHRQMLTSAWISRASAIQRAGRTGRVRKGNVYRLYTKKAFDSCLEEFEPGEMVRIPLDSVILMLKQILHEEVEPVFRECLEPPALETIGRSFQSLYYWNFLTEASDQADITPLGSFVSALGIDLSLGSFVGLGIQLGVAAEAIEMAAMMSVPKTPFQIASPMWLTPGRFNKTAAQTYASKCRFDAGLYSGPMGLMNALWEYVSDGSRLYPFCKKHNLAPKRWQQVISSRNSLRRRVADFLGIHEEKLEVQLPPWDMPHEKLVILRILKVWVFSESIVECSPSKLQFSHDGSVALSIKGKSSISLEESHLDQILDPQQHPFSIVERNEIEQTGVFQAEGPFSFPQFVQGFESRLLSYLSEKNINAALCYSNEELYLYIEKKKSPDKEPPEFLNTFAALLNFQDRYAYDVTNKKRRGICERASGIWTVVGAPITDNPFTRQKEFLRIDMNQNEVGGEFENTRASLIHEFLGYDSKSKMIWHLFTQKQSKKQKKKTSSSQPFSVTTIGECRKISNNDLEDLLGRKPLSVSTNTRNSAQSIVLRQAPTLPQRKVKSFREPLFKDVPESARILAMLASSQRKGKRHVLKIPRDGQNMESEETYDFAMKENEIDISFRWRRLDTANPVYVDDSVPASAIHTTNDLFAVAANGLELRSGGLRVEGLTLLPPNPLFLLLSHLSFGLEISNPLSWASTINGGGGDDKKKISRSYAWLVKRAIKVYKTNSNRGDQVILNIPPAADQTGLQQEVYQEEDLKNRLEQAVAFHESASSMGEKLVCFPEKIRELCKLYNMVDGHNLSPWGFLEEEGLTIENLKKWQWERKSSCNEGQQKHSCRISPAAPQAVAEPQVVAKPSNDNMNAHVLLKTSSNNRLEQHAIRHFDNRLTTLSRKWFATTLAEGEDMPIFPSTNILALLFQLFEEYAQSNDATCTNNRNFKVSLDTLNWDIACVKEKNGKSFYKARFVNKSIPMIPVFGRGKNKLPKWVKKNKGRPSTLIEALQCIPPNLPVCPTPVESEMNGLLFESIEDALKMESAFWLNQQFCQAGKSWTRPWYVHSMDQMMEMLRKHENKS